MTSLVMGPDETFQLESIRPKPRPTAVGSPSPSRSVMPTSTSGHSLASASSRTSKSSRRRSSSLPELPQPNDLFSASRGPSPVKPEWLVSPGKLVDQATHVRQRSESRITASAIATPAARPRISMVPQSTGSRRISLSVGAIPSSAAASLRGIELNTARSYHSRDSSIHQTPSTGLGRPTSDVKPSTLAAKGTTATVRNRLGPAETIRTESKSRSGSTSTVRPTEAGRISFPPASRIAITGASTTRPQTIAARPAPARTPPVNVSHKVTAVATRARSIGLPQPGVGPTARSAPTATAQSRTFGANADSSINRLARPVISTLANRTKLSAGLAASPSKRDVPSVTSLKSRALSTPASAFTRQIIASQSRATRPPIELLKKQSMLASTGTGSTSALPKPRTGSTLPRPSTTRLPSPSGKMSNPPVGGLASLRERLDRLQVRAGK
jgi:hypothetical protein